MVPIATLTMNPSLDCFFEVDKLESKRKLRSSFFRYEPGGGGINVARAIQRHDGDVQAFFPVGGANGSKLTDLLTREEVTCQTISVCAETRENFVVYVTASGKLYHFVTPGSQLEEKDAQHCYEAIKQVRSDSLFLVASGSLPPGVDDEFYARIAHLAHRRNWHLVLDTSGEALKAALKEKIYLVKPNIAEFADLAGAALSDNEIERRQQIKQLTEDCHAEILVVTLDDEGALLSTRHQQIRARPPSVTSVSPVGAGDSFVALLTLKLAQLRGFDEALGYGVAGAAAAVLTSGTELYRVEDVENLYQQMVAGEQNIQVFNNP